MFDGLQFLVNSKQRIIKPNAQTKCFQTSNKYKLIHKVAIFRFITTTITKMLSLQKKEKKDNLGFMSIRKMKLIKVIHKITFDK